MAGFPVIQITEGEWTSVKYWDVLGVKIPSFFTKDPEVLADYISRFETRPDDVFVVSYPKSGTTWVQEIVWQIYNQGAISTERQMFRFPYFEGAACSAVREMLVDFKTLPSPRLMKTHLPYPTTPKIAKKDAQCKYIYVARNPKDVAVSYFHFMEDWRKLGIFDFSGPWEFACKLFIEGNVAWNAWNDHVLDWWKHKDDPNVLFLKYEDLHKDSPLHVRMIANFLNKQLSDELINRIAEQCTFKNMKKNEISYKIRNEDSSLLLRKGVVGGWKNYFTPELNERFEKEVLEKLKGTGLEFDFEI
ncbi:sulfotransferase 1B1-like [Porites lutea]|uniref:sulfotransferase 1B1-like n=1 Tax=Porites lutea TaxID=51062 RepID=UPI003CC5BF01